MECRPTAANIIEFKRCAAKAKRLIKQTKRETWRKFCNQLTPETPTQTVWNMIKKMNNGRVTNNTILCVDGMIIKDEQTQAHIFADKIEEKANIPSTHITERQKQVIKGRKN